MGPDFYDGARRAIILLAFHPRSDGIGRPRVANITIRQLEDEIVAGLKKKAQKSGRSMEAEVREILRTAVRGQQWLETWLEDTKALRGDPLPIPPRSKPRTIDFP